MSSGLDFGSQITIVVEASFIQRASLLKAFSNISRYGHGCTPQL
jgi:hypothetical protein